LAFRLAASGRTVAPKPLLLTFKIGQLYETAAAYEIQLVGAGFVYTLCGLFFRNEPLFLK
jgi:hypothetical protein